MIKRPFFGSAKPMLRYSVPPRDIDEIPVPDRVVLLFDNALNQGGIYAIKVGDAVKTGQKLTVFEGSDGYVISTVTGTIAEIKSFTGDFGKLYTAISIDKNADDEWESPLGQGEIDLKSAAACFQCLPGKPCFKALTDESKAIKSIVINGMDQDVLTSTNQYAVQTNPKQIKAAVDFFKKIEGIEKVSITVPSRLVSIAGSTGADVEEVDESYPNGLPKIIMKDVFGIEVPAEQEPESAGFSFISAEAAAAMGAAISGANLPVDKVLTVIKKDGSMTTVKARIGTPIKAIFDAVGVKSANGDRVILGGPLRGSAIYSEYLPIRPNTDAVMIQDGASLATVSDYPCINCGECVRVCPANIPINDLVRYLENAQYENAADLCDLYSCVECGLCSTVCPSKIPLFQYIRLGKYELERMKLAEAAND
jgi:electron transport complex protein RnfC